MNRSTVLHRALISCVAIGTLAAAGPALADHSRKADAEARHNERGLAGTLVIDGTCYRIFDDCDINAQIIKALECAGYDAWCRGSSIRVRAGRDGPDICWRGGEYDLSVKRAGRYFSLRLVRCEPVEKCDDGHRREGSGVRFTIRIGEHGGR